MIQVPAPMQNAPMSGLPPPQQQQIPVQHTPPMATRQTSTWSSGYDPTPSQPASYTLQSSLTLQQSVPQYVAFNIQQGPPPPVHIMSPPSSQGPPQMISRPPHVGHVPHMGLPQNMCGPPPNIMPPPMGMPPQAMGMMHQPHMPMQGMGQQQYVGPPQQQSGIGQQQHQFGPPPSGIGRGGRVWQY